MSNFKKITIIIAVVALAVIIGIIIKNQADLRREGLKNDQHEVQINTSN